MPRRTQEDIDTAHRIIAEAEASLTTRSRYAMGGDAPRDTDGRMSVATSRARLIGQSLCAIIDGEGNTEVDHETIRAFGLMALELADELDAIHTINIAESWRDVLVKVGEPTAV